MNDKEKKTTPAGVGPWHDNCEHMIPERCQECLVGDGHTAPLALVKRQIQDVRKLNTLTVDPAKIDLALEAIQLHLGTLALSRCVPLPKGVRKIEWAITKRFEQHLDLDPRARVTLVIEDV